MTDQTAAADSIEGAEGEAAPKKKGLSGKKLIIFIVLPLLLLIGGGAGVYFSGLLGGGEEPVEQAEEGGHGEAAAEAGHGAEEGHVGPATFYELPDLLVNLNTGNRSQAFLRLTVAFELTGPTATAVIEQVQPRIIDSFQVYLRELRVQDLSGSAGMQRLREELMLRVNAAAQANVVKDVLFKEMLIQ